MNLLKGTHVRITAAPHEPGKLTYGQDCRMMVAEVVDGDASIVAIPNVKSIKVECAGRDKPVIATLEIVGVEVDVEGVIHIPERSETIPPASTKE